MTRSGPVCRTGTPRERAATTAFAAPECLSLADYDGTVDRASLQRDPVERLGGRAGDLAAGPGRRRRGLCDGDGRAGFASWKAVSDRCQPRVFLSFAERYPAPVLGCRLRIRDVDGAAFRLVCRRRGDRAGRIVLAGPRLTDKTKAGHTE